MPIITIPRWPLGSEVMCEVCETVWTVIDGDQARIEVSDQAKTITVDVDCPACHTRYTATKTIGEHRTPAWEQSPADEQYNRVEPAPVPDWQAEDVAGVHDESDGLSNAETIADSLPVEERAELERIVDGLGGKTTADMAGIERPLGYVGDAEGLM